MPESSSQQNDLIETVLLLYMSVARIQASMTQGNSSVSQMIESVGHIKKEVRELEQLKGEHTTGLTQDIQQMIVGLQFYDRLSQRLDNVSNSLSTLAELLSNKLTHNDQIEWTKLKNQVLNSCVMEDEARICDLIFQGKSVEAVLHQIESEGLLQTDSHDNNENGDALFF